MKRALFLTTMLIAGYLGGCTPAKPAPEAPEQGCTSCDELNAIAGQKGLAPNKDAFRFVVMADRNGGQETGKWAQAVEEINRLRPDFVMCVGDLARGYKEDAPKLAAEWDEFHAENSRLRAPFFYTPGNHDVLGIETRKAYAQRHNVAGRPYYSFDFRQCHFVVLDTTCMVETKTEGELVAAQWDWLAKDLATTARSKHVFVFMHFPLWSRPVEWGKLRAMIDTAKTTMFAGHTHVLNHCVVDGVDCHTLCVTAVKLDSSSLAEGTFQMYAHVTVDGGEPTVAYVPVGQVLAPTVLDDAAEALLKAQIDQAVLTTVSAKGGPTTLYMVNTSKYEVTCAVQWLPATGDLKRILPPAESLKLAAGAQASRSFDFPAGSGGTLPRAKLEYKCTLMGKLQTATREVPIPVVQEIKALRIENAAVDGKLDEWKDLAPVRPDGGPASPRYRIAYDDQNLYLAADVSDPAIIIDGKQPWERDGIEIFWDPRQGEKQSGPFAGDCRQLLIPVPPEGQSATVFTNPDDKALAGAVKAACLRTKSGYSTEVAIPFSAIAKDFKPAPGRSLRMDLYVDDVSKPKGDVTVLPLSGKPESSRQTAHYVIVKFE